MNSDPAKAAVTPGGGERSSEAMPTVVAGRYRIERLLGKGGFGRVYLAQHVNTGEHVALKLLSEKLTEPEFVERFKREMRAPAQIRSGHVVRVLDADVAPELNGAPFFVMEQLSGQDLHQRLKTRGPLSSDGVVWVFGQIAKALSRAHDLGLVHRDLKPENIYLHQPPDAPAMVKLLDFGLVHSVQSAQSSGAALTAAGNGSQAELERAPTLAQLGAPVPDTARLTATGAMLGTPLYMAPEQIDSSRAATGPATDIWALGMIAFELLVGQSYWPEASPMRVYANILAGQLVPPSQRSKLLPPPFDEWFARSCAAQTGDRWPDVNAQVQALATALDVDPSWLQRLEPPWSSSGEVSPGDSSGGLAKAGAMAGRSSLGKGRPEGRRSGGPATAQINRRQRDEAAAETPGKRRLMVLLLLLLLLLGAIVVWRGALSSRPTVNTPTGPAVTTAPEPGPKALPPPAQPVVPTTTAPDSLPETAPKSPGPSHGSHRPKRARGDSATRPRGRGEYVPAAP